MEKMQKSHNNTKNKDDKLFRFAIAVEIIMKKLKNIQKEYEGLQLL